MSEVITDGLQVLYIVFW